MRRNTQRKVFGACASMMALSVACAAFAQSPRQIAVGETLRGDLETTDAVLDDDSFYDVYRFQTSAGQAYVVTLNSDDFDAYLHVTGPGGLSETNDDGAGGANSKIEFTASAAGTIEIRANSLEAKGVGRYSISLQPGVANREIEFGDTLFGELTAASPLHSDGTPYQSFVFQGEQGDSVTIEMATDDFDAYLILRRVSSGEQLATDDDGGGGTDAELTYTLPADGAYEILANAISADSRGLFALDLNAGADTRDAPVKPITYGRVIRGELNAAASGRDSGGLYYDAYSFSGRRGDEIIIDVSSSDFDPMLFVGYSGDEEWLEDNDDVDDDNTDAQIVFTLPRNGDYEVHVVSYEAGETGSYMLGLAVEP